MRTKKQEIILDIVERIKQGYKPEKIILFGSYAHGDPTRDSDIDLFIIKKTKKRRIDRFVAVKRLAYDPDRELSFSPIVYTPEEVEERLSLGDGFVEEILNEGKVLYVRQGKNPR